MKNILIIGIALFLSACGRNKPVDLSQNKAAEAKKFETVLISKGSINSAIKLPGQLKPFEQVDIYPKVNGFIKDMFVDRGSVVKQGQLLMTLEAPEIDQQLQAARAKLVQAEEALNASRDRYYRLSSASKTAGSVSELDLVNARSKYQSDSALQQSEKANVSAVQTLKDYLQVKAPFDGVITERNVHPGTLTGPNFKMDNKPLLVLQDIKKLRLEVFIPEEYAEHVDAANKEISFTTDALPGQVFTANIARSSKSLYDAYRSEAVEADVMNPKNIFKPGMYVEASLKVKSDMLSYIIPTSAIITTTEGKFVVVNEAGKAKLIHVKEGISNNGSTEVFGNFNGREMVVKNPVNEIKDGEAI